MPTRKEIDKKIEKTLSAFKNRLDENKGDEKPFWSDGGKGGGLQIMCEGLEAFLIPHFSKPSEYPEYLSAEFLREQVGEIDTIVEKESFVPTPYDTYKALRNLNVDPAEFIDPVSYILTLSIHVEEMLKQIGGLNSETKKKLDKLIDKSLNWIIDTHIPNEGWSGTTEKTITHIYPTWSAISVLPEIEFLKSTASDEMRDLMKKFEDVVSETRKCLINFAKDQADENIWKPQITQTMQASILYNVYWLDTLIKLDVQRDNSELVLNLAKKILNGWDENRDWFKRSETHAIYVADPKETDKKKFNYEDSSSLVLSIKSLSTWGTVYGKDKLSKVDFSSNETLDEKLEITLEQMFLDLNKEYYQGGVWTDVEKEFSIYMTERVIEAMLAYAEFLGVPEPTLTEINEKIDTLIEIISKIDQDIVITRLSATNEKVESLENILEEVNDNLKNLSARFALEQAKEESEVSPLKEVKSPNLKKGSEK